MLSFKEILSWTNKVFNLELFSLGKLAFTVWSHNNRSVRINIPIGVTIFSEHGIEIPFPQRDVHIIKNEKRLESQLTL